MFELLYKKNTQRVASASLQFTSLAHKQTYFFLMASRHKRLVNCEGANKSIFFFQSYQGIYFSPFFIKTKRLQKEHTTFILDERQTKGFSFVKRWFFLKKIKNTHSLLWSIKIQQKTQLLFERDKMKKKLHHHFIRQFKKNVRLPKKDWKAEKKKKKKHL